MVNVNYNLMAEHRDVLFNVSSGVVSNANILGLINSDVKDYQLKSTFDALSLRKIKLDEAEEAKSFSMTAAKVLLLAGLVLLGAGVAGIVLGSSGSGLMAFGIAATVFGGLFTLISPCIAGGASTSEMSKSVHEEERVFIDLANSMGKIKIVDPKYADTLADMTRKHGHYKEYGEVYQFMKQLEALQAILNKQGA